MALFSWLRPPAGDVPPPDAALGEPAPADDRALDTLAAVLRSFGTHAPAIDEPGPTECARVANGWSEHLLLGRPPPDVPHPAPGRDYGSLRRSVAAWRRREVQAVDGALLGLRSVVWALIGGFNAALGDDARQDADVRAQLDRIRLAVAGEDLGALREEVLGASAAIASSVTERRRAQKERADALGARIQSLTSALHEARREGLTDGLTRLGNRKGLDAHLDRLTELALLVESRATLVLVDIDHFKRVNDRCGHPAGDAVLRAVADTLARTFIRKGDFLARYGGEELVAVLGDTGAGSAVAPVDRLLDAIRALEVKHGAHTIQVTVTAGVAELARGDSPGAWLSRADAALYAGKAAGRDRAIYAGAPA